MGLILVDTTVLIDNLRDEPHSEVALNAAAERGDHLCGSVITKAELLAGMRSHERRATRELMDALDWVPVSDEIAELGGTFARRFRASHNGIGLPDILIGATAEHLGAELWTRNPRRFPMFPDLRAPY
jgi:predicted nucleic acid-binding protein